MPRKLVPISPLDPYHINARANNRENFHLPIQEVWEITNRYLYFIAHAFECKIHAFVLMDNHFHLISTFPKGNIGESMNYFMRETSKEFGRCTNRINHAWGSPAKPSRISSYQYFMAAYKYVYRNPVKAKLCERVEGYKYSTLHGLLGQSSILAPVVEDTILFGQDGFERVLDWLNTTPLKANEEAVKRALAKSDFKIASADHRLPHTLETEQF